MYRLSFEKWTAISCFPHSDRELVKQIDSSIYTLPKQSVICGQSSQCSQWDSLNVSCSMYDSLFCTGFEHFFWGAIRLKLQLNSTVLENVLKILLVGADLLECVWMFLFIHVYEAFVFCCDVVVVDNDWHTNHPNRKAKVKNLGILLLYSDAKAAMHTNKIRRVTPPITRKHPNWTHLNVAWIDFKLDGGFFFVCFFVRWWFCYVFISWSIYKNARWKMERMAFIWNDRISVRWATANNMICAVCTYHT